MTLGAPRRLGFAAVMLVIGVALFVRTFVAAPSQPIVATAAVERGAEPGTPPPDRPGRRLRVRRRPASDTGKNVVLSLDPRLRLDLLKSSEQTEYRGAGRNIFRAEAEIPAPIAPAVKPGPQPPPPNPGPPPPPPINLKFFGFASRPGEPQKVFLAQGEDVFIAGEGDIVARRYKVLKIGPASVEIEDMLSNHRQTIPLTQG